MANPTGAFGLCPVRHLNGSPWNGATIPCYVSASYATALFVGDPVLMETAAANKDATGKKPTIIKSAGTDGTIIWGVITSFQPTDRDSKVYNPASTERVANVCVDPTVIYQVRGDGGGTVTDLFPGLNAVLIQTAAGSTVTGLSGFHLDEGTTDAPAVDQTNTLYILNIADREDNELGDNSVWEVLLNTNENATGRYLGVLAS